MFTMVQDLRVTKKMASEEISARKAAYHPRNITTTLYEVCEPPTTQ